MIRPPSISYRHEWTKILSRPYTVQRFSMIWTYLTTGLPQDASIRFNGFMCLPDGKKHDSYAYEDEWMACLGKLADYLLQREAEEQKSIFEEDAQAFVGRAQEITGQDLAAWTDAELLRWFRYFSEAYDRFTLYCFAPWAVDLVLAPHLLEILRASDPARSAGWFEVISTPTRPNRMTEQRVDLLRIAIHGDATALVDHAKKYGWLPVYNLNDAPWTEEDFQKHLADVADPQEELDEILEIYAQRQKAYQQTLAEIYPENELERLIDVVHLYTFLRDERMDRQKMVHTLIRPFYVELARRAHVAVEDTVNFFNEDIEAFLKHGTVPADLCERKQEHRALLVRDGKGKVFVGDEVEALRAREFGVQVIAPVQELQGFGAYPGYAKGYARVIHSANGLAALKQGEILITQHTGPEHVLAMKRAAAIVTDEGGITCHAAIVSRELKIPCVTATHRGSEIIKTGDLIEVDAIKGIVRKVI